MTPDAHPQSDANQDPSAKGAKRRFNLGSWAWLFAVIATLVIAAPWKIVDTDTLSRLAVGRTIKRQGPTFTQDPFTYSQPATRWTNPEWLGDLLWYTVYQAGSERGLIFVKFALVSLGFASAFLFASYRGANAAQLALIMLIMLPAAIVRIHVRNSIHGLFFIPIFLIFLDSSLRTKDRRYLLALLPLALLWANLHSSFILGGMLLASILLDHLYDSDYQGAPNATRSKMTWTLVACLFVYPLVGFISPNGLHNYDQLIDHLRGSAVYRALILEWQPGGSARSLLTAMPLHLTGIIGLLSFLPACNRQRPGGLVRFASALLMAHSSLRFGPFLSLIAAPEIAINLGRWNTIQRATNPKSPLARWIDRALLVAGGTVALSIAWIGRQQPEPAVLLRRDAPIAAGRFLASEAPSGVRLFNPYNSGPFLLWLTGPRIQTTIDPRNNLGAEALSNYVNHLIRTPQRFAAHIKQFDVDLVLTDLGDGRMSAISQHLTRRATWHLIFFDGRFAIYARETSNTKEMIARHRYRFLRGTLDFISLFAVRNRPDFLKEVQRTKQQSAALAHALAGYLLLAQAGVPPPDLHAALSRKLAAQAQHHLQQALPHLPASPALMSYLAAAEFRLGHRDAYLDVMNIARSLFPTAIQIKRLDNQATSVR